MERRDRPTDLNSVMAVHMKNRFRYKRDVTGGLGHRH